jgi:large subunit ribosomal protein L37Ae
MSDVKHYGGKLGPRYGRKIHARVTEVEKKQRVKQECPQCGKSAKRVNPGVFECPTCGKFTGGAYYV